MNVSTRFRLFALSALLAGIVCLTPVPSYSETSKPDKKPTVPAKKAPDKKADKPKGEEKSKDEEASPSGPDGDPDSYEAKYKLDESDPTGDHYTSIIIDATDLHLTTCMSPKICTGDGEKVWPKLDYIDPDFVIECGIVVYAYSLDEAKALKRAGKNPFVIKATGRGKSEDDPVVSDGDAQSMLVANKRNKCMDKFKVIFIIDKKTFKKADDSKEAPKADEKPADKKSDMG